MLAKRDTFPEIKRTAADTIVPVGSKTRITESGTLPRLIIYHSRIRVVLLSIRKVATIVMGSAIESSKVAVRLKRDIIAKGQTARLKSQFSILFKLL